MGRAKTVSEIMIQILLIAGLILMISSCGMEIEPGDGTMIVRFTENTRSIWSPNNNPDYMNIESYRITVTHSDGSETLIREIDRTTAYVMDGIPSGVIAIDIKGFNGGLDDDEQVTGQQIAYLSKNASGEHVIETIVYRGEVTDVSATLVPIDSEGSGTLSVTLNWPDDTDLIVLNPVVVIRVVNISDTFSNYTAFSYDETFELETGSDGTLLDAAGTLTKTITDLLPGWYYISIDLFSQHDALLWHGIKYARITYDPNTAGPITTEGTINITETMLQTGSGDFTIDTSLMDDVIPVSISATVAESSGTVLLPDGSFLMDAETGTAAITVTTSAVENESRINTWWIDGEEQLPLTSTNSRTFTFYEPGTYTVQLVVIDENKMGIQEIQVIVLQE